MTPGPLSRVRERARVRVPLSRVRERVRVRAVEE